MARQAYLDTHVIIWLHDAELSKFSNTSKGIIETFDLLVSEFVRLELQYLYEIKKLRKSPKAILEKVTNEIGIRMCSLPAQTIINQAMGLKWTRDPFDRLITANAMAADDVLLTKDGRILSHYAKACF